MNLEQFHRLDAASAAAELLRCCGSRRWAADVVAARPFRDVEALRAAARAAWARAGRADVLEALAAHPRIGASADELRARFATTATWSAGEQAGVAAANETTLAGLADGNAAYDRKFGHGFVICATGLSAEAMLAALSARLGNDADTELAVAAAEQGKITDLRLEKLFA